MHVKQDRDDFSAALKDALAKRSSYVCSNPNCRSLTVAASTTTPDKFTYVGKAAHITGASPGGPRYEATMSASERASADNGIFLCSTCADMIDKNKGVDHPVDLLRRWKREHEEWTRANLNKSLHALITTIDGEHVARGLGDVTGLDVRGPAIIRPGTRVTAEGVGTVTATRIGPERPEDK